MWVCRRSSYWQNWVKWALRLFFYTSRYLWLCLVEDNMRVTFSGTRVASFLRSVPNMIELLTSKQVLLPIDIRETSVSDVGKLCLMFSVKYMLIHRHWWFIGAAFKAQSGLDRSAGCRIVFVFLFFFFLLTLLCSPLWHFVLICAHAGQLCDSLPWMFSSQRYRFRVNEWERVMFVTTVKMCMLLCRADCCKTDVTFRVKTINKQDEA